MRRKGIAVLVSALMLAVSLTGCGKQEVLDGTETAATLDDTTSMTLGEFNLMLRYQEAQMEAYYAAMFGTSNIYGQDLSGTGTIYGETAKESLLEQFKELYVLEAEAANYGVELTDEEKAAITEAAQQFVSDNTEKTLNALGADQTSVERLLTLAAVQDKMYDALTADVDTEVSDEEALQKRIAYVFVSTEGTETDVLHLAPPGGFPHLLAADKVLPRTFRRKNCAALSGKTLGIGRGTAVHRDETVAGNRRHRLTQILNHPLHRRIAPLLLPIEISAGNQNVQRTLAQLDKGGQKGVPRQDRIPDRSTKKIKFGIFHREFSSLKSEPLRSSRVAAIIQ